MGEISGNILMDLGVMADEVIGPLLCNPENQKGWPKIVQNDMKRHVIELRNLMHQVGTNTTVLCKQLAYLPMGHSLYCFLATAPRR